MTSGHPTFLFPTDLLMWRVSVGRYWFMYAKSSTGCGEIQDSSNLAGSLYKWNQLKSLVGDG